MNHQSVVMNTKQRGFNESETNDGEASMNLSRDDKDESEQIEKPSKDEVGQLVASLKSNAGVESEAPNASDIPP